MLQRTVPSIVVVTSVGGSDSVKVADTTEVLGRAGVDRRAGLGVQAPVCQTSARQISARQTSAR